MTGTYRKKFRDTSETKGAQVSVPLRYSNEIVSVCLLCGGAISPERIAAIPWAAYCVGCQEQTVRRHIEAGADAA